MWGLVKYNRAVTIDEQVNGQWAQVENQLQPRFDILQENYPNLTKPMNHT